MFTPVTPIVGAAITGLTSPTYPLTLDMAPSFNGKQYAVLTLGGTQTGVDPHTVSKPFTHTMFRPAQIKTLPSVNANGVIKDIPVNQYKIVSRKGAVPAVNQLPRIPKITTIIEIDAGTETYEPEEIKALISAHFGLLFGNAQEIYNTVTTGLM